MSSNTLSLILNLVLLSILALWLAVGLFRKRLVRWICLRKISRGQMAAVETILAEARQNHFISYKDEENLRIEMRLEMVCSSPASADTRPDLKSHIQDLYYFYFPKRKNHVQKDDLGSKAP